MDQALQGRPEISGILDIADAWENIMQTRSRIRNPQVRNLHADMLDQLHERKDALITSRQEDIVSFTSAELVRVHSIVQTAETIGDINRLLGNSARNFLRSVQLVQNADQAASLVGQYGKTIAERTLTIRVSERTALPDIRTQARLLLESIGEVTSALSATTFETYPLVTAVQTLAKLLPEPQAADILSRLETYRFQASVDGTSSIALGFTYNASGDLLVAGRTFPVRAAQSLAIPELRRVGLTNQLVFVDGRGNEYIPGQAGGGVYLAGRTIDDLDVRAAIERFALDAQEALTQRVENAIPNGSRLVPYHEEVLGQIIDGLAMQRKLGSLVVLEGEAGTGKNVLISMFATAANLPLTVIPCDRSKTLEDLTYSFSYQASTGTLRLPSLLIDALQRPGIVALDEFNALEPGVVKAFNSAFDGRRSLTIVDGDIKRTITIHPECSILALINPLQYRGTQRFSAEFSDRTIPVTMPYPPFEIQHGRDKPTYRHDEVLLNAQYIPSLADMTPEDIGIAWNYLKNELRYNGGDVILAANPGSREALERMYDLLRVAKAVRDSYEAYQLRKASEPISQPFTLRRIAHIVAAMELRQTSIEAAVDEFYIPLLPVEQRAFVRKIVELTLHPERAEQERRRSRGY